MTFPAQAQAQDTIDFAAAFEEGLAEGIAAIATPADPVDPPAPTDPVDPPAPTDPVDPPAPADPVDPPALADHVDPAPADPADPPADPAPAPAPIPAAVDWEARARALEAQLSVRPAPAPAEPPSAPAPVAMYTPEETEALAAYQTDWPDIAKAEALTRRAEYRELLDYVFSKMNEQLAPVQQYTQTASGDMHYNKLVQAHADYDQIVDKVEDWVAKQPDFLRKSLTEVATSGDTKDVIELVSMYKQATGVQQASPPPPVVIPPATTHPSKQAAAQRLSPVSSQRTGSQAAGALPETFEEAFKLFSAE